VTRGYWKKLMDTPLRFLPFLRPMVWGGRRLGDILGKPLATAAPYGESWEISDHPMHRSIVADGPYAGQTLHDLMERNRHDLLGLAADRYETFPWLVKFLDACDWLSVQVHPDEEAVRTLLPGEGSKTEAWFVIQTAPESRIYAGLLPGIDRAKLRGALAAGTVTECLHSFQPRPGDCVFLPAGTVHAVGGGVLMAEVQQTSDATFRLFDWNRCDAQGKSRMLHVEQSLASIHWDQGPVQPIRTGTGNEPDRRPLVRCRYFDLELLRPRGASRIAGTGRLTVAIILSGSCRLEHHKGKEALHTGEAWVLPATMPEATVYPDPDAEMLICSLP
jgi:mannose-6-phosphate isomerase